VKTKQNKQWGVREGKLYDATQLVIPCKFVIWEFVGSRLSWAFEIAFWYWFWL
jgi:hypothetical protein